MPSMQQPIPIRNPTLSHNQALQSLRQGNERRARQRLRHLTTRSLATLMLVARDSAVIRRHLALASVTVDLIRTEIYRREQIAQHHPLPCSPETIHGGAA